MLLDKHDILQVTKVFLVTRLMIFAVMIAATQITLNAVPASEGVTYHASFDSAHGIKQPLRRVLRSADVWWYLDIAKNGYHKVPYTKETPHNWVLFPLFPLLVRGLNLAGVGFLLAGTLIANAAALLAMLGLDLLAKEEGFSQKERRTMLWLLAVFPSSYFLLCGA